MRIIGKEIYVCDFCGKIIKKESGYPETSHTSYTVQEPEWSGGCIAAFDRSELPYDFYDVMDEQPEFHYCWTSECDTRLMEKWVARQEGWKDCIYLAYALYYGRVQALANLEGCTLEELGITLS